MRVRRVIVPAIIALCVALAAGCRSAVVVTPRDPDKQTVVTVEERPATQPGDKGLVVQHKD